MANDLAAMIARVSSEMARPDFAIGGTREQMCRNAITTAISEYQKQRFRFSDIDPALPQTFQTEALKSVYDIVSNSNIPTILMIDYLNIAIGNTLMQMDRGDPERIHLDIQLYNQQGMPTSYAYEGNKIIIYPVPDTAYTIYIGGHLSVAAPANDAEQFNPWMTVGERLIRCRTKYELYTHVLRNDKEVARYSPDIDGNNGRPGESYTAFRSLKGEGNKITGLGRVKPMRF